ncbi:hypothetical protein [Prauserella endophytica]|uniref:hypothetical protein n=1 Tax=Prauserella endophytica TaxID=1592324 RepID=UPI0010BE9EDE|nr:hypothetical protein [Prauserella endophytica]
MLELDPEPTTEFAAPFGLVRSRAVTDEAKRVRTAPDVARQRRGEWATRAPSPQHGAFLSEDAIASAAEVLGGRVFFEVVQRLRGYAGYGAVNAPVRMAAHRRAPRPETGK